MDLVDIIIDKFSKSMMKRNKGVAVNPNRSFSSKADMIKEFQKSKKVYSRDLNRNLNSLILGKIDKPTYLELQRKVIKTNFRNSYRLGKTFSQSTETELSPDEIRSLGVQIGNEMKFMEKFADDVESRSGKMDYSKRMKMYSEGLVALFVFGQMVYLPEGIKIFWVLGDTDKHCVDCLSFAYNSPYTKKTLPAVPKACLTACLSNCHCKLEYPSIGPNDDYAYFILDKYSDSGDVVPEPADVVNLQDMIVSYYFYRGMSHINKDKEMGKLAANEKKKLRDTIKENKFTIKREVPVGRYLREIDLFKRNENFEITTSTEGLVGEIVSVHRAGMQVYGHVFETGEDYIQIKTLYGVEKLFQLKDSIIFRQKQGV